MSVSQFFAKILGRKARPSREQVMRVFKRRYVSFKDLLQSNTELANIMAGLEEHLRGDTLFTINQIRAESTKAVFHTMRMVTSLNTISKDHYLRLNTVLENINARITTELDQRPTSCHREFTLPMAEITASNADQVGGKCANLGEISNTVGLTVPRGFAITTSAYSALLHGSGLLEEVRKLMRNVQASDQDSVQQVSTMVQELLLAAPLPPSVEQALYESWDRTFGEDAPKVLTSLRSSAVGEDGHNSFAGQYRTILGVQRSNLTSAFSQVAASLFSPRAITYRLAHGYIFEQSLMAMVCLEMVDAVAAGVAFSRHPVDSRSDRVLINGLWGLGELVVDGGASPDTWEVQRDDYAIHSRHIVEKKQHLQLTHAEHGVIVSPLPVPPEKQMQPCLTDAQAAEVARLTLSLETHYGRPQDVEWAVNPEGQIIMLQSRPMRMADGRTYSGPRPGRIAGATLLLEGGDIASSGVGHGPVVQAGPDDDLSSFPQGGVLLAHHSSPNLVVVMDRAAAIVAERGSLTGHMASVCREFHLPTLLNLKDACQILTPGMEVTVDALSGRVYQGEVPALLRLKSGDAVHFNNTPVHALLQRVAEHILPLHLIDPKSSLFSPEHCTSLHDVMRFVHEQSYNEMFRLSDSASDAGAVAVRLRSIIPLDLYLIDLGEGLINPEARQVQADQVLSWPFKALLQGMLNPDVHSRGPRPVDMSGFLAVMSQSMIGGNNAGGERFGERSYAIISDHYCNFSSRVGYHYAVLDSWCGNTMNKNYITFKFAGGAADEVRRSRRVRCIGKILEALDFRVDVVGDRVQARFQKYPKEEIESRLDQMGRLLIVTRQMDMLMVNEEAIQTFADKFLQGEYH